jgi:CRISPR/Cas system-associated exonuclease Cas4 (RecB family)
VNPNHTERKHARLSASRADRFMTCPGSVRLESQMPEEPPGEAAAVGTAIHELAEAMLRGDAINQADYPDSHWNMASSYVKFINELIENPRKKLIEVNVDDGLKSLHQALGGTADAVLVDGNHLHVIDLKTGRVPVEAENNRQLLTYAVGVMRKFKAPSDITCTMHIFQPMVGHSSWTVDGARLIQHGVDLQEAATLALSYDAPTNPSPDACKYCRAKTICPSIRQKVQDNARKEFSEDTTVTPEMLDLAAIATSWAEAVQDAAKQQIKQDKPIQGWTLRPGRKTRFWKAESLAIEALKDHPEAFDLKSPSAIEKLGISVSQELIGEKQAAESLVRAKPAV